MNFLIHKSSKKIFGLAVLSIFGIFFWSPLARASTSDFVITNFDAVYTLDNSKPGGYMIANEKIDVNFSDQNHGILRSIPKKYHKLDTHIKVQSVLRDGRSEQFSTYSENGNLVLKIGDPSNTTTGSHQYIINYTQDRIINFESGKPEFYWDVNGNDWAQKFEHIKATVVSKSGGLPAGQDLVCYTGAQGSTTHDCMSSSAPNEARFSTIRTLFPGENMTVVVPLENGIYTKPVVGKIEKLKQNPIFLVAFYSWPTLLAVSVLLWLWNKYGKDYKTSGVTVPHYGPPKNLSPAEVGMLADYRVDSKDLSATLIDLAVRKYIKIHEDTKKIWIYTSRNYSLELINNDVSKLKPYEQALLKGIFPQLTNGQIVSMQDLKKNYAFASSTISKVKKEIKDSLTKSYGLIENQGGSKLIIYIVAMIVIFIISAILPDKGYMFPLFLLIPITIIFSNFFSRRTHAGVGLYEQIMGLKMYMDVAEQDRLSMLQGVDRTFVEPTKTVDLFEKLLPFAVALGVEKSWAKQFDGVLTESPDWISSNATSFSAINLASSLGSVTTNFSNSFETSSGSSGGSSGGGGGGGGGGGW